MSAYPVAQPLPRRLGSARGLRAAYLAEQRKLLAQTSTRVVAFLCALAPLAFALVVSRQSGVPADSLLGVWVHSSGYAVGFVVLDFAGYLGFPILAAIAAGDLFSCEDRYATWKTLLTRSRSRAQLFTAKVLAGCALASGLALLAAASTIAGGLAFVGSQPLVDLSGNVLPSGEALALLLCSWVLSLVPLCAFVAIAILLSVASRSGIVGVCGTIVAGLLMQLLGFLGSGSWTHALLPAASFDDWHGLLSSPPFYAPMAIALAVSLAWFAAALGGAWLLLRRREFAGPPVTSLRGWLPSAQLVAAGVIVFVALAAASALGRTAITPARLQDSLARSFERLTVLQQSELGRNVPAQSRLNLITHCSRRSGAATGAGDDWICTITIVSTQSGANPLSLTPIAYDVSVKANGCYKADAPPSFVGQQTMPDVQGHGVVNPLYTIYGCFDTTGSARGCLGGARCESSSAPAVTGPSSAAPRTTPRTTTKPRQPETGLRLEAERKAGPKVIKEQEEAERYYEHQEHAAEPAPSG